MNNGLSYSGLVNPRISASDKDLPVCLSCKKLHVNIIPCKKSFLIRIDKKTAKINERFQNFFLPYKIKLGFVKH